MWGHLDKSAVFISERDGWSELCGIVLGIEKCSFKQNNVSLYEQGNTMTM